MMASPNPAVAGHNGHGRPTFASQTFLEKKSISGLRTSTPGSEALESSDDEREPPAAMSASMHSIKSNPPNPIAQRRPSWLSEVQQSTAQAKPRKFSIGGASHASSGSQPTTPLNENGPWDMSGSATRPGTSGMWSSQIWQKDRPSRLVEVMASPTNTMHIDDMRSPTSVAPGGLPFEIPLEPNRKTIRSQSYSAGQLEKVPGMEHLQQQPTYARMRSVAHRPSRPSMLGEGSRDMLSSLREDEDDNEDLSGSDNGYPLQHTTSLQNPPRALNTYAKAPSPLPHAGMRLQSRSGTFPMSPNSDYAVGDEDTNDNSQDLGRAMARNVIGGSSNGSSTGNLTVVASASAAARSKWQSQLGFGVPEDGSQSRRHSFAAEHLPSRTRNNSMAAVNAMGVPPELGQQMQYGGYNSLNSPFSQMDPSQQHIIAQNMVAHDDPSYFGGNETMRRNMRDAAEPYNPFALPNVFSRPQRILYLVVFKCSRADIYYIPENTGLQVKTGDTVIVEGDRGQDLGTVEAINITMDVAKKLKDEYLRKQYKCLMMFSRMYPHIATIANDDEQFEQAIIASKNMQQSSMHGGGPQQESEPRPKMIKRVARPDEVHLLREKEGNEAKAKRVCQTKVNDHGLRMEILDAEFQHDYRKLTFFYYAEEYINFNDLVTDLFKVYKTRIWMSAINPASFSGHGNPNSGQRAQQWPRQGPHANYIRPQENQTPVDGGRTQSPMDYDTPAAQGNREYERLYGNAGYPVGLGMSNTMAPGLADYQASLAPQYAPHGLGAPQFSPNATQFTPFANQFGNLGVPWSMPNQYQQSDLNIPTNYAVGPAASGPNMGLNQQATAFTPRAAVKRNTNGHPATKDEDFDSVEEQMRRFNLNQRPQ